MGQILPGVPVWSMANDSRWPGLPLVVFPGNVGGKEALAEAMIKVQSTGHFSQWAIIRSWSQNDRGITANHVKLLKCPAHDFFSLMACVQPLTHVANVRLLRLFCSLARDPQKHQHRLVNGAHMSEMSEIPPRQQPHRRCCTPTQADQASATAPWTCWRKREVAEPQWELLPSTAWKESEPWCVLLRLLGAPPSCR